MDSLKEEKNGFGINNNSNLKNGGEEKNQDDDIFEDLDENYENKQATSSPKVKYGKYEEDHKGFRKEQADDHHDYLGDDPANFYGINKRLYRKSDTYDPPKTGTDFVLLPQNPTFIKSVDLQEPVFLPKQNILEECLRREAEKICFHETLLNKVVYDCVDPSYYTKNLNCKDYDVDILPFYIPTSKDDHTLVFESRFESGNLRRAIQIYDYEYNLILKPDYFTRGHTQWYYFSVANTRKDKEYRFNIINMMKPDSLYNCGMKPLVYSEAAARYKKQGWHRDGYDICYYQNNMKRRNAGYYYTLTFAIKFKYDHDTVYFAHCFPYTYTDLCTFLKSVEEDPYKKKMIRRKPLCQTIAGNNCDMLIITNFAHDLDANKEKKGIAITARVHPGETQSSIVMESIIDFLTGPSPEARALRDNFIIRIVPMLNPDGVINGNYRCNLAGVDLNRQWVDPSKKLHPTIFSTKLMLRKMKEERELLLFCDIHGHSRKKNIFIYGCSGKDNKRRELVFPLLYRNNCDFFSFKDSSFIIQKDRETTARVVVWRELSVINCYTLEMSFCGPDVGRYEYLHFNYEMFREVAISFCQTILDLADPEQTKVKVVMDEIEQNFLKLPEINKKDDGTNKNQDDQDSDYSNDEETLAKNDPIPNPNVNPENNPSSNLNSQQSIFSSNGNQSGMMAPVSNMQTNQLSVINELDDKKKKKKKTTKKP